MFDVGDRTDSEKVKRHVEKVREERDVETC